MCTAMTLQTVRGDVFFGRTMDFSHVLDPQIYRMPRGFEWNNSINTVKFTNRYRFIGIGQELSKVIFADGVNEMGFAAAVLYFPGYAAYEEMDFRDSRKTTVAALELVNFMLGMCASVEQAAALLPTIRIIGTEDPVTNSVAPLHWITTDKSGRCMVIERTGDGLHMWNNPLGVLSNSPDFKWHMTNLRNYMNLSPKQQPEAVWGNIRLTPFGQGGGTAGLPGGFTPPARFVRTAFLKTHVPVPESREEAVTSCFHIMESVTIPKGVVVTGSGAYDYTQYTAFMNVAAGEYFIKTYDNSQILTAGLFGESLPGREPESLGRMSKPIAFETFK